MFKFFNKNNEKLADKMFKKNEKQLMDELGEILYISGVHPMDITDDELISIQKSLNKAIENHTIKKNKKVQKTKQLLDKIKLFFSKHQLKKKPVIRKNVIDDVRNDTKNEYNKVVNQIIDLNSKIAYSECRESKDKNKYIDVNDFALDDFINKNQNEYNEYFNNLPKYYQDNRVKTRFLIKYLNKKMKKQLPTIMKEIYSLTNCKWVEYNDELTKKNLNNIIKVVYDNFDPENIALSIQRVDRKDFVVLINFKLGFKINDIICVIPQSSWLTPLDDFSIVIDTRVMNEMYEQTNEENNE